MKKLEEIIKNYINGTLSLRTIENEIIVLMDADENIILDDILEDIAYTYQSNQKEDSNLISEEQLKNRLKKYLTKI